MGGLRCGGGNGYGTVEWGTEAEVRAKVQKAMEVLAPGGGFILSPVENVRDTSQHTWDNTLALLDEWKALTGQDLLMSGAVND